MAVLLGLSVGAVVADRLQAQARPLHVVNGFESPLEVTLDGGPALRVAPGAHTVTTLPEGRHRAEATLAGSSGAVVLEPVSFELGGDGVVARWLGRTTYVLAPGGGAALLLEEARYGPDAPPPAPGELVAGAAFVTLVGIDHPFEPFDDEAPAGTRRRRVSRIEGRPLAVLAQLPAEVRTSSAALAYLEAQLRAAPERGDALAPAYVALAREGDAAARARDFLRLGLAGASARERLAWHRAYQDVSEALAPGDPALREEYARRLAAAAEDAPGERAALHYLVGRVAADPRQAEAAYRAALACEEPFARAHHALAVLGLRQARFAAAARHAARARELAPDDRAVREVHDELRLALGEVAPLRDELEAALAARPLDLAAHLRLLAVLVDAGELALARERQQAFRQRIAARGDDPEQVALLAELQLRGYEGDAAGVLESARALRDPARRARLQAEALLELGRPSEAEPLLGASPPAALSLLLALERARLGEAAEASAARERARSALAAGGPDERAVAALLAADPSAPLDLEAVRALDLSPPFKATLLLLLAADRPPAERGALLELAARYSFRPGSPRALLRRAAAWLE